MIRILLIIVLIIVIFALFRNSSVKKAVVDKDKRKLPAEKMVKCRYCGVHMLIEESIVVKDVYYCSDEHHKLADPTNGHSS